VGRGGVGKATAPARTLRAAQAEHPGTYSQPSPVPAPFPNSFRESLPGRPGTELPRPPTPWQHTPERLKAQGEGTKEQSAGHSAVHAVGCKVGPACCRHCPMHHSPRFSYQMPSPAFRPAILAHLGVHAGALKVE